MNTVATRGSLTLRVALMPADVNATGDIFGGWVLGKVDIAGASAAARRADGRVTIVAVNSVQFKNPVAVGDVLSFYTTIERTGRTSITVSVDVFADRRMSKMPTVKVTEALLTYVAIDGNGCKRSIPDESLQPGQ
jgi:acyl-CoA thioesterase YciA